MPRPAAPAERQDAGAAQAGPTRFEAAPFPRRDRTRADLAAAERGLAVREDPDA